MKGRNRTSAGGGFTLIEMLVSVAVLGLLLLLVTGIVNSATKAADGVGRRLDTSTIARGAFERMAVDFSQLAWDGDATLILDPSGQDNDALAFVCRARAPASANDPRMAGIFYAVQNSRDAVLGANNVPMLVRGFKTIDWNDFLAAESAGASQAAAGGAGAANYSSLVIGDGVFRMCVVLHLDNGQVVAANDGSVADRELETFSAEGSLGTGYMALDLSKIRAVTIGLAVLDQKSRMLSVNDLDAIAAKLERPAAGRFPLEAWTEVNWDAAGLSPAATAAARQNIRFFQRTFDLPHSTNL